MSIASHNAVKIRITYGKDETTDRYRKGYEKLKKDLEKKYGEKIQVTGKKSSDRDNVFEVAFREGEDLNIFWKEGIIESESDLHKIFAEVEKKLAHASDK